jgi:hypothetical protein
MPNKNFSSAKKILLVTITLFFSTQIIKSQETSTFTAPTTHIKPKSKLSNIEKLANATQDLFLNKKAKKHWLSLLTTIKTTRNQQLKKSFYLLTRKLAKLNMLQLWIQTSFTPAYQKTPTNTHATLKLLIQEYDQTSDLLSELLYKKQRLENIDKTFWNHQKQCLQQWDKLKTISNFFLTEQLTTGHKDRVSPDVKYQFTKTFKQTTPFGKQAALKIMSKTIASLEKAITTIKSDTKQTETYKNMSNTLHSLKEAYNKKTV